MTEREKTEECQAPSGVPLGSDPPVGHFEKIQRLDFPQNFPGTFNIVTFKIRGMCTANKTGCVNFFASIIDECA